MIRKSREVVKKWDVEFFTSTETTLKLLITWDQVWPRVSFPCFYRHPPQVKYTYTNRWKNQVLSLSLDNICFCSLTTETNTRGAPPTRAYNPYRVPNLYNHNISLALSNLNTLENTNVSGSGYDEELIITHQRIEYDRERFKREPVYFW